jgi:biopolymer transport protein ExbD
MKFLTRKRRQPPAIIIISLIDILIVLLIFLMVTTTFKQQPALKLVLPESKQGKEGASEANLIVTIAKDVSYVFLGQRPIRIDKLPQELSDHTAKNPGVTLAIRADTEGQIGQLIKVRDAAVEANIRTIYIYTKRAGQP